MSAEGFKRKLTAVFSADVVGYSRLMGEDETATVKTLETYKEVISSLVKQHRGRVVDSPGDNLLADFASVVDAVQCAVAVQKELQARNEDLSENRKMLFRIGINLGDVIEEQGRIYGDGVNIAARLESLADPGGICISKTAFDYIENKLPFGYRFIGQQPVKNIAKPVAAYKVLMDPRVIDDVEEEDVKVEIHSKSKHPLRDKPSIAVLPFINMSKDPDQEYFSDGMTEELIGALAKLEGLKVISRTSVFFFKGKDVKLRQVGKELKVANVLEGSVRKAGNKLRITAQLINVADDTHIWSDSYNRELIDVFDIQEEISQAIVKSLKVKLLGMANERLVKDYTKNTEAYELYLKGKYFENKGPMQFEKAIEYMEKAIKAEPEYAPAYAYMAAMLGIISNLQSLPPWEMTPKTSALRQKALELDDKFGFTYVLLGMAKVHEYDWQKAESYMKRALELTPGHDCCYNGYSQYLAAVGRMEEAILEIERAVELDPLSSMHRAFHGRYLVFIGQFDRAIEISQEALELDSNNPWVASTLALAYGGKGRYDEGISILQRFGVVPYFAAVLGYLYGKAGNIEEAQKILDVFMDRSKKGYFSPYMIAQVYSGLDEKDKVFEWLERAYEVRDQNQYLIKVDIVFHSIHSDPRWAEQMKKRGLAD